MLFGVVSTPLPTPPATTPAPGQTFTIQRPAMPATNWINASAIHPVTANDLILNQYADIVDPLQTAQGGGANTITLAAGDTSTAAQIVGLRLELKGGAGAGQSATILSYDATTKIATITANNASPAPAAANWTTPPDNTTQYRIVDSNYAGTFEAFNGDLTPLTDGTTGVGNDEASSNTNALFDRDQVFHVTYTLGGASPNPLGYDLSEIDSVTGHQDSRIDQVIDVQVQFVGSDTTFYSLSGGRNFEYDPGGAGSAQLSIIDDTGAGNSFVTNVKAVRFVSLATDPNGLAGGGPVFRELSVVGAPSTTPFPPGAPAAPTALAVSLQGNAVKLTWTDNANNEIGYIVQRASSAGGPFTTISGTGAERGTGRTATLIDSNVAPNTTYFYRVIAFNSVGQSAPSNVAGPITTPNVGAEAHYYNQAFWAGPVTNVQVFSVDQNTGGHLLPGDRGFGNSAIFTGKVHTDTAGTYTFVSNSDDDGYLYVNGQLVSEDPGGHGQRDASTLFPISLAANTDYNFVLLMSNGTGGAGAHLEWIEPGAAAGTLPSVVPTDHLKPVSDTPTAPTNLALDQSATPPNPSSHAVNFSFDSDNIATVHYILQRRPSTSTSATDWVNVNQTDPGAQTDSFNPTKFLQQITDASALPGSSYQYRVVAMNFDGTSAPSNTLTVSIPALATTNPPGVEGRFFNGEFGTSGSEDPRNISATGTPQAFVDIAFTQGPPGGGPIDVGWGASSPEPTLYPDIPHIHNDSFTTLYTGQIVTDAAGVYTFISNTNNDGYMWVNGVEVSQDPGGHGEEDATTLVPLTLAANTAYDFVFIQVEQTGSAAAHAEWIEPDGMGGFKPKAVIPAFVPANAGGPIGGFLEFSDVPHHQSIDATGHITNFPTESAAGAVTVANATGGGVTVSWTDQSPSELWFDVQRSTDGTTFTSIGRAGFNTTSFTDTTAAAGTHYFYRVRGVNYDGAGPFSNTADITPGSSTSQTVNGTAGNDTITIRKDATDATLDDIWVNAATTGAPTQQALAGQTIVINGGGGTDTLTLDSTNGNPIPTGGTAVLRLNSGAGSFTIGGSLPTLDATHVVDVGTSTVNIPYTGTSILPAVQSDLKNGFIKSSDAAGSSGKFAVADTDTGTQITLKYLVIGDLNGDGSVNFNDLLALAQHYGNTGADWAKGDLNYDGTVNFNDLLALAQHYGQTAAVTAASASSGAAAAAPLLSSDALVSTLTKSKKARSRH